MREIGSFWRPLRDLQVSPDADLLRAPCQAALRIFIYFFPGVTALRTPVWTNFFPYHRATEDVFGPAEVRECFGQEHIRVLGVMLSGIRRVSDDDHRV